MALATSGLYPAGQALATFENDLLTAVAASITAGNNGMLTTAETSTLQTELGTAFSSSVSSSTELNQLYNDELAIVQDSNITTANITTITSDQAKISADLAASSSGSSSTSTTTTTSTTMAAGCEGDGGGGDRDGGAESLATASVASLLLPGFAGPGYH